MRHPVHLLESTLRDGSYEIDFQFTAADTALLVAAYEKAGFSKVRRVLDTDTRDGERVRCWLMERRGTPIGRLDGETTRP